MQILRWNIPWMTLYSNKNLVNSGLVIPAGPYVELAGAQYVRVFGEAESNTDAMSFPKLTPGVQFANVESTTIVVQDAVPASWAPPAFFPPDTTTPWTDLSANAGKYLLARPVYTVYSGTNGTLQMVAARAVFEIRFG